MQAGRLSTQKGAQMKAIRVHQHGGPETMMLEDVPMPVPGPKHALDRLAVAGVNFIDVYFRTGLYKAETPTALGNEGAGVVEAVGPDVTELAVGDRVAYAMARGSYAEHAVVPAAALVKLPETVTFQQGAAAMLQGMTAHYLTHSTYPLKHGDSCLVHAAAGGAGLLIVQMAKARGARVFGTATAGAALPSTITDLPNGDGFQYAIANYTSYGGDVVEGRGVQPDTAVAPTRNGLLAGHDEVLESAVKWIQSQPKK